jgi:hypothetical protein
MRIRLICTFALLCALVAPFGANRATAQSQSSEKPVQYTYVSEWTVPRAMWAEYLKGDAADVDQMKKGVSDGAITSFGSYVIINHQEGLPTHGTWFTATSMANLLKVLEAVRTAPGATAPPLAAAKHWDYILESHNYGAQSGTFTNGYLRVGRWSPKPGATDADGKMLKATIVPVLDKLLEDGALHDYSIDEETVHSATPGTMFIAIITNGAEGLDKFNSALEEAQKANPAAWAGFGATIENSNHTDFLARVPNMTHK